jgi:hypothetical protein
LIKVGIGIPNQYLYYAFRLNPENICIPAGHCFTAGFIKGNGSAKDPAAKLAVENTAAPESAKSAPDDCLDAESGVSRRKFNCLRRIAKDFMDYLMSDDDLWD